MIISYYRIDYHAGNAAVVPLRWHRLWTVQYFFGICIYVIIPTHFLGDRIPQGFTSPRNGILINILIYSINCSLLYRFRGSKIGEILG